MHRNQSPERLILHQISSLIYPKIQRRQVIKKVLHLSCAMCMAAPVVASSSLEEV